MIHIHRPLYSVLVIAFFVSVTSVYAESALGRLFRYDNQLWGKASTILPHRTVESTPVKNGYEPAVRSFKAPGETKAEEPTETNENGEPNLNGYTIKDAKVRMVLDQETGRVEPQIVATIEEFKSKKEKDLLVKSSEIGKFKPGKHFLDGTPNGPVMNPLTGSTNPKDQPRWFICKSKNSKDCSKDGNPIEFEQVNKVIPEK